MEYTKGIAGRVFLVKFDHEDDLLHGLEMLAVREKISVATVTCLGAIKRADIVTGPEKDVIPPTPHWTGFDKARETIAFGTLIKKDDGKIKVHMHGSFGRGRGALTGCLRERSEVFITIEAVVTEIKNIRATKKKDKRTGIEFLVFK